MSIKDKLGSLHQCLIQNASGSIPTFVTTGVSTHPTTPLHPTTQDVSSSSMVPMGSQTS